VDVRFAGVSAVGHPTLNRGFTTVVIIKNCKGVQLHRLYSPVLQESDLSYGSLNNADFQGESLGWCNFYEANLKYANFEGADLRGAVLKYANLTGANLRWADLTGADLTGAILDKCDLEHSKGYHGQKGV
jgi:uncharacterized protein YjbI with pentapeptide repeats